MTISGAEAVLKSLKSNGVKYLFANPGSDFAPVIEAYSAIDDWDTIPRYIIAPHENVCVGLAHGYYLATGEIQAAMVHVNVGLANAAMGLINARSDDVPIFLMSGRTPLTEHGRKGSRGTPIQYGQEQFDQTAMVREVVKWEYELRYAENAAALVSRGLAIARSEPVGSAYMSLPREPLCEETDDNPPTPNQVSASCTFPDPNAIDEAAQALANARNPLIVCCRGDAEGQVSQQLCAIADENAIAISEVFATRNVIPSDHPMGVGPNLPSLLPNADVVLVVDSGVAWVEKNARPSADATVIHLGPDPLFSRMPVRSYKTSLAIQCNTVSGLKALRSALPGTPNEARSATIRAHHEAFRQRFADMAAPNPDGSITKAYIARCVSEVLDEDGVVFNERGAHFASYDLAGPNRWFGNTQAGGLGWCMPAALGYLLANRERLTVAVMGDGSYMFANPVACHTLAEAYQLPLLTIVLNNDSYDAVRTSTLEVFPDGAVAQKNEIPMVPFDASPDYCTVAAANKAWTRRVEAPEDLPAALAEAVAVIKRDKRQALLDVVCGESDNIK